MEKTLIEIIEANFTELNRNLQELREQAKEATKVLKEVCEKADILFPEQSPSEDAPIVYPDEKGEPKEFQTSPLKEDTKEHDD